LCREEGLALSTLHKSGSLGNAKLYGIIKEVAPVKGALTDEELGVGEFQSKYFPHDLYRDADQQFYNLLGSRNLFTDNSIPSWNPFSIYSSYQNLKARLRSKSLKGNMAGEGIRLGGIIIAAPGRDIVYTYLEKTGQEIPENEIVEACKSAGC
jgi:hypothetical protein